MSWKYCPGCRNGQDRITLEDIWAHESSAIICEHCDSPRDDDTPEERMAVMANEIYDLKEALAKLTERVLAE